MKIHIGRNGVQEGPYESEEVIAKLAAGQLAGADLAWTAGDAAWRPLTVFLSAHGLLHTASGYAGDLGDPLAVLGRPATHAEFAAAARERMHGLYWETFAVIFVAGLLGGLAAVIPWLGQFINLFIQPIFVVGLLSFMVKRARPRGPRAEMNDIFTGFKTYGRTLGAYYYLGLWMLIWLLPAVTLAGMAVAFLSDKIYVAGVLFGFFAAIASVAVIPKLFGYSLHLYLCLDRPDRPVTECLTESVRLMAGHRWRLFVMNLYITWKPLLAMVVLMGAVGAAVGVFFAANRSGSQEPTPESLFVLIPVLLVAGVVYLPVYYFWMRVSMRAGVARVCFYDERLRLGDKAPEGIAGAGATGDDDLL